MEKSKFINERYVTQIYQANEIGHVISGKISSRKQLGLPDNWNMVEEWLDTTSDKSAAYESNGRIFPC
jgi:hypothetical protein